MCFSIEKTKLLFSLEGQAGPCKDHDQNKARFLCIKENCPLPIICQDCKIKQSHDHPQELIDLKTIDIDELFQSFQPMLKSINEYQHKYCTLLDYQNQFFFDLKMFSKNKDVKCFVKKYMDLKNTLISLFPGIQKSWNSHLQSALLAEPMEFDPVENKLKYHNIIWTERPIPYYIDENVKKKKNLESLIELTLEEFQNCTIPNLFKKISKEEETFRFEFRHIHIISNDDNYENYTIPRSDQEKSVSIISLSRQVQKRHILHEIMHALGFSEEHQRADNPNPFPGDFINVDSYPLTSYDQDSIMQYKYIWGECPEKLSKGDIEGVKEIYGGPFCCNFDPQNKAFGVNFECIDCWGENTDISICLYCRIMHHQNHKVVKNKREGYFCDCGRFEHQINLCTKVLTESEKKSCKQNLFKCLNCGDNDFCVACEKNCHNGHEIEKSKENYGVCKCKGEICNKSLFKSILI